jgi:hypothetical protein
MWSKSIEVLRIALAARKPDAIDRIKLHIRKLEAELGPLVSTIAIQEARLRTGRHVNVDRTATMRQRVEIIQSRLADLRALLRGVKSTSIPDTGATPETASRAPMMRDIPDDLVGPAMDLRCGWMVRTAGAREAIMRYDEVRIVGSPGETATRLERAYVAWRGAMAHMRLLTWPTEIVVCEGRSLLESARRRHMDPRIIGCLLQAGLLTYQTAA